MFQKPLVLEKVSRKLWRVYNELTWKADTETLTIPRSFLTQFGSVPRLAIDRYRYCEPAILHDFLYKVQASGYPRKRCDIIFREALKARKCGLIRRWIAYAIVRLLAGRAWSRNRKHRLSIINQLQ